MFNKIIKVIPMFFLLLTAMIISFVVGTTLMVKAEVEFGLIAIAVGALIFLFIVFYYRKKKKRKRKFDCEPDCDCGPDLDCDCGPDCG
jgi:O-antigen/teichoic acid export membrane protein